MSSTISRLVKRGFLSQLPPKENIDDFEFFPGLKTKIKKILTIKEDYQAQVKKNHCKMKQKNLNYKLLITLHYNL